MISLFLYAYKTNDGFWISSNFISCFLLQYVMIIAEKLLWIPLICFGSAEYLVIALIIYYHKQKQSQMQ